MLTTSKSFLSEHVGLAEWMDDQKQSFLSEHVGLAEWMDDQKHDKVRPSQTTPETSSQTQQEQMPVIFAA